MKGGTRRLYLGLGVALAGVAAIAALGAGLEKEAAVTAGVTALCAVWWVTEPIPVAVTSLVPFVIFPLTGVLDHARVAHSYGHTLILLLMGGFMLSQAVSRSGVHRRLALGMVRLCGRGGRGLVLGFMLASALCSMWISNTATVLMLLPVVLAVISDAGEEVEPDADAGPDATDATDASDKSGLAIPLLLGIAYAASIGGMGTPVGTPPNIILMGIYKESTGQEISFLEWMRVGVPAVVLFLPIAWWYVTRRVGRMYVPEIEVSGAWHVCEARVLAVFALTAAAWIFREEPYGGWSELVGAYTASDSTVALAAVVLMFLIPDGRGGALLDWPTAVRIPWGLLLLFGGGIAISAGFQASGLAEALGDVLGQVVDLPLIAVMGIICLSVTFLTEITSNTATTNLLMPILAAAAAAASLEPMLLMVPAAMSASCAFMLPVATAPNAIVSGTPYITTRVMAREGLVLNVVGACVLSAVCFALL